MITTSRPDPSCRLLEVDFSAIEAKLTGWCARLPEVIRLAGLGIHGALASHILGRPYDPDAPDADLKSLFEEIKEAHFPVYDRAKRAVYGDFYGQTAYGMMMTFPENFPTLKEATKYKTLLHKMAPGLPRWQTEVRERAYRQNFLGGPGDHPFGYKHWFWSVLGFRAIPEHVYHKRIRAGEPCTIIQGRHYAVTLGEDAKRCLPPDTPVWMGDYTYRALGDVRVGDVVIGWKRGAGPKLPSRGRPGTAYMARNKAYRTDHLVRATVLATHQYLDTTLTLHMASGRRIRCTADHQWNVLRRHEYEWRQAKELRVGDTVMRVDAEDPGECPPELRERAAWLGGFYDGEGSHRGITQAVNTDGDLLQYAEETLRALGFETTHQVYQRSAGWKRVVYLAWGGGRQAALKFRRWVPSRRFAAQWADRMILTARFRTPDTVVAIEANPLVEPVACITTTTGNFVADGYCSHNCVAFYPQSIAAAILKEALLRLFDPDSPSYIGDAYFGRTPLRAPIHDSGLFEIPDRCFDRVFERIVFEMTKAVPELPLDWIAPAERARLKLGTHLHIGVAAKAGRDWHSVEKLTLPVFDHQKALGVPVDDEMGFPVEDLEEEDFDSMRTVWKEAAGAA